MKGAQLLRRPVEAALSALEAVVLRLLQVSGAEVCRPIFIIGVPRSGTTLLYQLMLARFELAYFSNFGAMFYASPAVGHYLRRLWPRRPGPISFKSAYGATSGWDGPHEAARFWYRWFPRGEQVYVGPGQLSGRTKRALRRQVAGWSRAAGRPLLFKNTFNAMRLAPLAEAFPEALFLVTRRRPLGAAQSILRARRKTGGGEAAWWSVPPRQLPSIRTKPYWEQVVEQVYYIEKQIEADLPADRSLTVSYEALCADPRAILADIAHFCAQHGVELKVQGEVPAQFPISQGPTVAAEEFERIRAEVAKRWT